MLAVSAQRIRVLQAHLEGPDGVTACSVLCSPCKADLPLDRNNKITSAEEAVQSIPDGAVLTVSAARSTASAYVHYFHLQGCNVGLLLE